VLLFNSGRKKQMAAQRLLVRIMNQQHQANTVRMQDSRQEQRSNATVPVMVVPYVDGRPVVDDAFPATTKDLSAVGIGIVARQAMPAEEVLIGFRADNDDDDVFFIRAKVKHQERISPDFYQAGLSTIEVLRASDYPLLATLLI